MRMPANTLRPQSELIGISAVAGQATTLTTVSNGSSTNYGAWTTLGTATRSLEGFLLCIEDVPNNTTNTTFVIQLALSTTVVTGPLLLDGLKWDKYTGAYGANNLMYVPLRIQAGETVRARFGRNSTGSYSLGVGLIGFTSLTGGQSGYTRAYHVGGTLPVGMSGPTATGDTSAFGAWAEVVYSTERDIDGLSWTVTRQTYSPDTANHVIASQVGIGAAGSEFPIAQAIHGMTWISGHVQSFADYAGPFSYRIPAGTRIAIRAKENRGGQPCAVHVMGWEL